MMTDDEAALVKLIEKLVHNLRPLASWSVVRQM
jgi:hypothetical protein